MFWFLIYIITGLLNIVSFALLALTQLPYRRAIGQPELSSFQTTRVRLLAVMLLGFALVWQIWTEGGGFGVLLWTGFVTLAALVVTLVLTFLPRALTPVAKWIADPCVGSAFRWAARFKKKKCYQHK
jgi:hypothetical protein